MLRASISKEYNFVNVFCVALIVIPNIFECLIGIAKQLDNRRATSDSTCVPK